MTLTEWKKSVEARLEAATPPKELAAEYAKVWLVQAIDKIVANLNNGDDVASVLEIAFADGYMTGDSHAKKPTDLRTALAVIQTLTEALEMLAAQVTPGETRTLKRSDCMATIAEAALERANELVSGGGK